MSKRRNRVVVLTSGERFNCYGDTDEGVITDAGIEPWEYVDGFLVWSRSLGRTVFVPVN